MRQLLSKENRELTVDTDEAFHNFGALKSVARRSLVHKIRGPTVFEALKL